MVSEALGQFLEALCDLNNRSEPAGCCCISGMTTCCSVLFTVENLNHCEFALLRDFVIR